MKNLGDIKRDILTLEAETRGMVTVWENRYAQAHLKEINLMAQMMLVQLEYADLADREGR